jgi:rfaE bifunctional protein kinase chain/domain
MKLMPQDRFDKITSQFTVAAPVLVLGDVGIDKYTYGEVRRISPEAPVPILEVSKEWLKLGLAANISHNLKTLGVDSTLCGVVGEDSRSTRFEGLLEEIGLRTWGVVRDGERPTTFKERITTNTQQICRIDYEDTKPVSDLVENKIIARTDDFVSNHTALIIEDYSKGSLSKRTIEHAIATFCEAGKLVAVDPGRMTPPAYYTGATILKPNLTEARAMVEGMGFTYRDNGPEAMAKVLIEKLKLEKIIITLGKEGMAMLDTKGDGKLSVIPTVAQEVYDVSGAGDTTIASLVAAMLSGASLTEAAWIANCAAGVVVAKKGTATVDLTELKEFYQRLLKRYA